MEDPNKDYLTHYRSFFEFFHKSADLTYPLPVKIANYTLTESEIAGDITTWCLQYLQERGCPNYLATLLCKQVLQEISRIEPSLCGFRPQEQVYHPLKLMQETIRILVEVCSLYSDNARLSQLHAPPTSMLYDPIVSMCGVKNSRRTMEDKHIAIQDLHTLFNVKNVSGPASYYAVFDGHNGNDAAIYANSHLHYHLVRSPHYVQDPELAFREAFATTDKLFMEKSTKGSSESGTTAVCALLRSEEKKLYISWLGDSQAILVSGEAIYQLVKPHRPGQEDEKKRIELMGGTVLHFGTWRVDGNLAVSRAIGDKLYKKYIISEPDVRVISLTGKEDYIILASDGLWDFISEELVVQAVEAYIEENKGEVGGVSKHLTDLAKKHLSRDNISCIAVFLRDPREVIKNKHNSSKMEELEQVDPVWRRQHHHHHSPSTSPTPITATSFDNNLMTATDLTTVSGDGGGDDSGSGGVLIVDAGSKHNGQMSNMMDDMGPETDVDSLDDVLLSPSIAAAKALSSAKQPQAVKHIPGRLEKEQQLWLRTLPWSYADAVKLNSPQKKLPIVVNKEEKEQVQVTKVNLNDEKVETQLQQQNVLSQETETVTETTTTTTIGTVNDNNLTEVSPPPATINNGADEASLQPTLSSQQNCASRQLQSPTTMTPTAVLADLSKGEELKSDVGVNDIESGEDSEEEWNYISGKESGNKKDIQIPVQQIQQELNAEETEEDMESQLNPNAAEFVPVFIPSNSGVKLEKDIILSSSPAKGSEQNLENIFIPSVKEFYSEISKRPSDLESLNHNKSLNETTLNGVDLTGISTKAVYGDDDSNFLSSLNNSAIASTAGDDEDEAIEVAGNLCDTNPFSPTHIPIAEPFVDEPLKKTDVIQEQMVQDHFSLGIKPLDPMTQSVTMMEDEGQHEDETSPDIDFMSSGKPDLLSPETNQVPTGIAVGNEAHEGHTSSSGFDSESGPDDGDHIPSEQCNLAAAAATVGISFGEEVDLQGIVNTKSMSLIDDSHPIEKIEQSLSPSVSPMPQLTSKEEIKEEIVEKEEITAKDESASKEEIIAKEEEIKTETPTETKSDVLFEETETTKLENVDVENVDFEDFLLKQGVTITEVEMKVSPDQVFDLVQKLQFTQEEPRTNSKNKDDEPESDSGFEIIHASEASNEPIVPIVEEVINKQNNIVESSVVNDLVPNYVPDILQASELSAERQLSPVGTGTGNIIADIEGAMLDSISPTSGHLINEQFIKVDEENPNKPGEFAADKLEEVFEGKNKVEEISKPLLVEEREQIKDGGILLGESLRDTTENETLKETGNVIDKLEGDVDFAKTFDDVKEVIQDALCAVVENRTEEISDSQTKETTYESASTLVTEEISETIKKDCEEVTKIPEEQLIQNSFDKKEIEEQLVRMESAVVNELFEKPAAIEPPVQKEPTVEEEKKVVDLMEGSLPLNEEKTKLEEVMPALPTPPTTPAPGVTEEADKQELITAALLAAGVAAGTGATVLTSTSETPKVEGKVVPTTKKPAGTTATASKKQEPSKMATAKPSLGISKSSAKPGLPASAATKKTAPAAGSTPKSTISKTSVSSTKQPTPATSKPSTPTSKIGATSRPSSAKASATTTTKSPALSAPPASKAPKPRAPPTTKPPTARPPAKPTTAATASPKRLETVATKKPLTSTTAKSSSPTTTSKTSTTVSKTTSLATAPKSTTKTTSGVASKTLMSKPTSTSTTKTSATSSSAPKPLTSTAGSTIGASKTTSLASTRAPASKPAPAKTTATKTSATKALPTKTKPATPTAIKKPLSSDKNIKDTANNKLSATKQAGAIKKNEVNKTIPIETKLIEPVTQEPTVTTSNGHIENGISNESSSPIEVTHN